MANCEQYYHCVTKDNFTGLTSTIALGILTGALTIIAIVAAVIGGAAIPGLGVVAGVLFVAAIFELCDYLHGGKLICLGDNSCVIGRIMEFIPVGSDKSGFEKIDDDFTFNILLSPHAPSLPWRASVSTARSSSSAAFHVVASLTHSSHAASGRSNSAFLRFGLLRAFSS